ncbi:glycoside hydrolase family 15 protein [Laccaria bicolor S238N-H82]|uniref:Glucoamylase n=1 Tax=Laccaria bicolor (strain S238N-H82 / ATCC MYA-4686) TaxID=486041 RepID=B0CVJ1_LACBS|nr:glycoside hydrolase family 15 protein [Laccaria bicolor S238N-H82]EDR13753.1 glycoside hydrolase family 15 protein [Laccaria bicolor S238N-H82]|eukprot:XP_001876251.1 glycoside hydrolase family 15 protein [Laccaria bicolor S238N-H82]
MEPPATRPRGPSCRLIFAFVAILIFASVGYLFLSGQIEFEYINQRFYFGSRIVHQLQALPLASMRSISLSVLGLCSGIFAQLTTVQVDQYIATESTSAMEGLLANIGPSGAKSSGAKPGVVIASPSTTDPNYLFTWTRDSSLVFKTIIDQFTRGEDSSFRTLIDQFVTAEAQLQQTPNPSGTISTGGLGEPKFNIDLSAFTGPWGRPQRDGPALRSTAIITYANWLIANSNTTFVTKTLWPIVKLDLDYVSTFWNQSGFDLWEEINSSSFFTTAVQHRALREGITLAQKIGQTSVVSDYTTQADNILCFLQSYWNPSNGYITSNTGGGRSGKDANSVLASIHTFDSSAGCDAATFQPCSDKALSSLKVYVDSFRSIYSINSGIAADASVATGRYPEDVYFNGNPWYLTTAAVAEQLYDALIVWKAQGSIEVTSTSLAFFRQLSPSVVTGTYSSSTSTFTTLINAVQTFADGFLAINAKYTPPNGGLAEQYSKIDGTPLSAVDLTWSYASALTAFAARKGVVPASWGAKDLAVPSICRANTGPIAEVTFNVYATTQFGETIFLTGSVDALQNWSPDKALALSSANYPTWSVTVAVPANTNIEYKYIRKFNGQVVWESDPNNAFTSPGSGQSVTLGDTWR